MAKLLFLAVCCVLLRTGYSLECYNCVSTPLNKNCDEFRDKSTIAVAQCGQVAGKAFISACITKVIEDTKTKMQNTTRACILTMNEKSPRECDAISEHIKVLSCNICTTDLCNSASILSMSTVAVFFSVLLISWLS